MDRSSARYNQGVFWFLEQTSYEYVGTTMVYYDAEQRETYGYDVDGRLTSVRIATQGYDDNGDGTVTPSAMGKAELKAVFGYDGLGRQISRRVGPKNLRRGDKWIADLTAAMLVASRRQDEQATAREP